MESAKLGRKIRALRRKQGLTQAALAKKLTISASYLNLIEHDRRPLSAALLLRLADLFKLDLRNFSGEADARLLDDLNEAFGDPLFEEHPVLNRDVSDLLVNTPDMARAVLHLYQAYVTARSSAQDLAERVLDDESITSFSRSTRPTDEVSDFLERHDNYFEELEQRSDQLWSELHLEVEDLYAGLARYLEQRHKVQLRIASVQEMKGALRRYDPSKRELLLSVVLRRGTRNFQLATQIGLLDCEDVLTNLSSDSRLTTDSARKLCRVALANYYAASVLMPYGAFLRAAKEERYDLVLLGHRFRASFEQVCHRLTTLKRPGAEGVPFHFVRVDMAGNLSKVLGESGIRFPRFSGLCPLWNVHSAFQRPGMIRVQISRMPDGKAFFSVARTVRKHRGGYHAANVLQAIALGCDIGYANELVYSDGVDLKNLRAGVPVGLTCRLCERMDCEARAFPPVQTPLRVDENLRGISFYTPPES